MEPWLQGDCMLCCFGVCSSSCWCHSFESGHARVPIINAWLQIYRNRLWKMSLVWRQTTFLRHYFLLLKLTLISVKSIALFLWTEVNKQPSQHRRVTLPSLTCFFSAVPGQFPHLGSCVGVEERTEAERSCSMDMGARWITATVHGRQAQIALALYQWCLPLILPAFIHSYCFFRLKKEQARCVLLHAVVYKQSCKKDYFHVT